MYGLEGSRCGCTGEVQMRKGHLDLRRNWKRLCAVLQRIVLATKWPTTLLEDERLSIDARLKANGACMIIYICIIYFYLNSIWLWMSGNYVFKKIDDDYVIDQLHL